jgi:hypothetical protein
MLPLEALAIRQVRFGCSWSGTRKCRRKRRADDIFNLLSRSGPGEYPAQNKRKKNFRELNVHFTPPTFESRVSHGAANDFPVYNSLRLEARTLAYLLAAAAGWFPA